MINIIRSEKKGRVGYTNISNEILQSKTLKPHEIGVLVHLLSLPADYVIHKSSIWKQMNIGRDQFDKVWKKLVQLGYIHTVKYRKDDSKKTFGYRHVVNEIPQSPENQCTENQSPENQCTDNQYMDNQYTDVGDIHTLISSNWKPGCIQTNNTNDSRTASNSRNEVKVRHGQTPDQNKPDQYIPDQNKPDQKILEQNMLDQIRLDPGNMILEDISIVPHTQLRFGSVRDNDEDQNETTSTKEKITEAKETTSTGISDSGVDISSVGKRAWIQELPIYDIVKDSIPEQFEPDETDINNFMDALEDLFKDEFPDWKKSLKKKPLHTFLKETSKVHEGFPEIMEMVTILKRHLFK